MSEFSGIDPKALPGMISSVQADAAKLRGRTGWIKDQFAFFGIDTQPLTDLQAIGQWADDQLPMLRRRQHLAVATDKDYPGMKGMVSIDESKVGQTAQSQKDGKNLGEQFKKALEDGDQIDPKLFDSLEQNANDGDFIKAFYDALGPTQLAWLSNEIANSFNDHYKQHPEEREKDRVTLAKTMGIYTQVAFEDQDAKTKAASWNKWFDGLTLLPERGFRPDLLTPLLAGGTHDKDFLVSLGDRVFATNKKTNENEFMSGSGKGPWESDSYTQLFDAIAQNTDASAEWFDHNYDGIQKMIYPAGPWRLDQPPSRAESFFKIATAATITAKETNPALAEKNVGRLLYDNYMHMKSTDTANWHPIEGTQELYAAIITSYWDDLEYSVTSPTGDILWGKDALAKGEEKFDPSTKWNLNSFQEAQDGSRAGLEVSPKLWQALMVESARDPEAAGTLSALFQAYDDKKNYDLTSTKTTHFNGESFVATQKGLMQQFYVQSFKEATTQLEMDLDKWVEDTNAFRAGLIDTVAGVGGGAAGGAGLAGVKGAAIGMAYGFGTDLITRWIKQGAQVDAKDAPKGLKNAFTEVDAAKADFSWRTDYRAMAATLMADGYNASKFEKVITTVTTAKGQHTSTSIGDPTEYIDGPSSNFLDSTGHILDEDDMSPEQRTAYGEWLKDPAVVAALWQDFSQSRNVRDWPGQDE